MNITELKKSWEEWKASPEHAIWPEIIEGFDELLGEAARLRADKEKADKELQRLTDLVRYQRAELHEACLITDSEYASLCGISGSPARLESYDDMRDRAERAEKACAEMRDKFERLRDYFDLPDGAFIVSNRFPFCRQIIQDALDSSTCGQGYVSKEEHEKALEVLRVNMNYETHRASIATGEAENLRAQLSRQSVSKEELRPTIDLLSVLQTFYKGWPIWNAAGADKELARLQKLMEAKP